MAYAGLGVSLQLKWKYLKRTVPVVATLMGPIKEALRETFFPALFEGEEVNFKFRKILGHIVKCVILDIPVPWSSARLHITNPRWLVSNWWAIS